MLNVGIVVEFDTNTLILIFKDYFLNRIYV